MGTQAYAYSGWSTSTAGDVNGDGYGDMLVSSPYYDTNQSNDGQVAAYLGAPSAQTRTITYTYDSLYRLLDASYSTSEGFAYQYDAVGNRLAMTDTSGTTTYTYDAANRLLDVNGTSYTYDANGNLTGDGTLTYTYDAANRLTSTTDGTSNSSYQYDGLGNRLAQTTDGITTQYVLDVAGGLPEVIAATTNGNTTYYLQVGGQLLAQQDGSTWAAILPDHLGSVRQVVDPDDYITLAQSYTPFGDVMESTGSGESAFGFTGEQQSGDMVYLRARYYQPGVGRFMRRDPFRGWQATPYSLHPYQYGYSNPMRYIDPSGMCNNTEYTAEGCPSWMPDWFYGGIEQLLSWTAAPIYGPNEDGQPHDIDDLVAQEYTFIDFLSDSHLYDAFSGILSEEVPVYNGPPVHDGYVIGYTGSIATFPGSGIVSGVWNECDIFGTGALGGELVFDFRHQESMLFTYGAAGETLVSVASVGTSLYEGLTWGFKNDVYDYGGRSLSLGLSLNFPLPYIKLPGVGGVDGSVGFSYGLPYNEDGSYAPNGVHAEYWSMGSSVGISSPKNSKNPLALVSGETMQLVVNPIQETFVDYNGNSSQHNRRVNRFAAAMIMNSEMQTANMLIGGAISVGGSTPTFESARTKLMFWAHYR